MTRAHNDDTQRMSNLHLKAMNEEAEQGKHTQRHMARNTDPQGGSTGRTILCFKIHTMSILCTYVYISIFQKY